MNTSQIALPLSHGKLWFDASDLETQNAPDSTTISLKRKAERELSNLRIKKRRLSARIADQSKRSPKNISVASDIEDSQEDLATINVAEIDDKEDEDIDFLPIEHYLAPQEMLLLRSDPWNRNILASTWSNDTTLVISSSSPKRNTKFDGAQCSGILPSDLWRSVLEYFDIFAIVQFSMVSRWHRQYYFNIPPTSWKNFFKSQQWRLPHEILNSLNPESGYEIIINEDKVDWINEFKRNYFNDRRIAELIEEITEKIRRIVGDPNLEVFEEALTDDEIKEIEEEDECPLTNDMRALYKNCSNSLWRLKLADEWEYIEVPKLEIQLPSPTLKISRFLQLEKAGFEVSSSEENSDAEGFRLDLNPEIEIFDPPQRIEFTNEELLSDSDSEYQPSISEISEGEQCTDNQKSETEPRQSQHVPPPVLGSSNEADPNLSQPATPKIYSNEESDESEGVFMHKQVGHHTPPNFESSSSASSDYPQLRMDYSMINIGSGVVYDPVLGAVSTFRRRYVDTVEIGPVGTIVDALQLISDYLDDQRAPFWIRGSKFKVDLSEIDLDELHEDLNTTADPFETLIWELGQYFRTELYMQPRALKLLASSAKQFLIDVFAKAQVIETSDVLQPDTFIEAANQMYRDSTIPLYEKQATKEHE